MSPEPHRWRTPLRAVVVTGLLLLPGQPPASAEEPASPRLNALRQEMAAGGARGPPPAPGGTPGPRRGGPGEGRAGGVSGGGSLKGPPRPPSRSRGTAAPKQPWIEPRPNVPAGRVEEHRFRSERLGNERILRIYTPPGYDPQGKPYGLLVVLDGRTYTSDVPTPTILDNLLAAGRLPPLVAVFVANPSPEARSLELSCHPPFAEFLARELIPWVRRGYRVTADPARTVIAGSSLGGLAAACAASKSSDVFGNVLSLSGSFYWRLPGETEPESLTRQLATGPKLPL